MHIIIKTDIDGLSDSDATRAQSELALAESTFQQVVSSLQSSNDEIHVSLRIRVTNRFEELVADHIARDSTSRELIYRQQREHIFVLGKTLCKVSGTHLDATVLLDTSLFCSTTNPLLRVTTPYHELFHVLAALHRLNLGQSHEPDTSTYAGQFDKLARYIYEEHQADCFVDNLFRRCKLGTDQHGNTLGVIDAIGGIEGMVTTIAPYFNYWCDWVVNRIQRYRETSQGLEEIPGELYKLQDFLTILAHSIAACRGAGVLDLLRKRLEEIRGFECFILPDWDAWIAILAQPQKQAIERLIALQHSFLFRCGLRLDDVDGGGVHIRVSEPCFCD